jgi:hypothetical protein
MSLGPLRRENKEIVCGKKCGGDKIYRVDTYVLYLHIPFHEGV